MLKRKVVLSLVTVILLVNLAIGYRSYCQEAAKSGENEVFDSISLMMEVLQHIRKFYVDSDKVNIKDLMYGAIEGMTMRLDPFSNFLPPQDAEDLRQESEGEFAGIGVTVNFHDGKLFIVSTIPGTPGARAELQQGDVILKVDGEDVVDMEAAVSKMRGKPGTAVVLTIQREQQEPMEVPIVREIITVPSVVYPTIFPDTHVAYLGITQFTEQTASQLAKELKSLEEKKIEGLIIDLRDNPGGLLHSAVEVCSFFLPANELVVSIEGRENKEQEMSRNGYKFPDSIPLILLINRNSASAAEITAGCLSDYNRAILLGEKSFGKGSVQNVIPMRDGCALKLTVAKYFTPSRRVIHGQGIPPNIHVALPRQNIIRLSKMGDDLPSRLAEDTQMHRAVEVMQTCIAQSAGRKGKFQSTDHAELFTAPPPQSIQDMDADDEGEGNVDDAPSDKSVDHPQIEGDGTPVQQEEK